MKKPSLVLFFIPVFILFSFFSKDKETAEEVSRATNIWNVRSVDTMKTSRDLAREKLNNKGYDEVIERDLKLIKDLGANYVAIDTPYDQEFYPYLERWVKQARKAGLKVWFRGNFSAWEGWFGYKKDMSPDEHLEQTIKFIETHPELFEDGDAFDPCPECENAGWWPQPQKNNEYNEFVIKQQEVMKKSFEKIDKKIYTNWKGIIGGRAREVLNSEAVKSLDNLVAIDHYTASTTDMAEYIKYFADTFNAQTLLSEFGAPIPDINGPMTEDSQAEFIDETMKVFYEQKNSVYGLNYFALNHGTTEIVSPIGLPKKAYYTLKKYYSPAIISGVITDELGYAVKNEPVETIDKLANTQTDSKGRFSLVLPAENSAITIGGKNYHPEIYDLELTYGQNKDLNVALSPIDPSWIYNFHLRVMNRNKK